MWQQRRRKKKTYKKDKNPVVEEIFPHEMRENPENEAMNTFENETENPLENVMFVSTTDLVKYDIAASHVVRRREYNVSCRMQYKYMWMLVLLIAISAVTGAAESDICALDSPEQFENEDIFFVWLSAILAIVEAMIFVLGRWSVSWTPQKAMSTTDAEVQKDEPLVDRRFREAMQMERAKAQQYRVAAIEARKALTLSTGDLQDLFENLTNGQKLMRRAIREMTDHATECPYNEDIVMARRNGRLWHLEGCTAMEDVPAQHRATLRACRLCIERRTPPDRVDHVFGGTLREDMEEWITSATHCRPENQLLGNDFPSV